MLEEKLTLEQRLLAIRICVEGGTTKEAQKELIDKFNVKITTRYINFLLTRAKYQPYVKQFKESYLQKVKEVPIANKRYRLDDVEKIRKSIIKMLDNNPLKTKSDRSEYIQQSGELRKIIDTAREEMEHKPQLISNVIMNMGEMSDDQLHSRKQELIARLRRFDGRRTSGAYSDRGVAGPEVEE